jgi:hypothetical protein
MKSTINKSIEDSLESIDFAQLYEVETRALNQAVKRNIKRGPGNCMFRLRVTEWGLIRSQIVTASQSKQNQQKIIFK